IALQLPPVSSPLGVDPPPHATSTTHAITGRMLSTITYAAIMMASKLGVAMLVLLSHIAMGATPPLKPYKAHDMSVSFPEGWTVEQKEGVYVAQRDPARKDSPSILFILSTASTTEDQLLDTMADKFAGDFTVIQRAPVSEGGGHFLIG